LTLNRYYGEHKNRESETVAESGLQIAFKIALEAAVNPTLGETALAEDPKGFSASEVAPEQGSAGTGECGKCCHQKVREALPSPHHSTGN
jgi:hypothetical protein